MNRRTFLEETSRMTGAAAVFTVAGCGRDGGENSQNQLLPHIAAYLDKRIPELLSETRVPGLSIAIVKDAALALRRSYGTTDVEMGTAVTDDTIFEAGSVSKTVFAYAVMKLCDRGVLSLDSPLTMYSPERPLDDRRLDQITVRDICMTTRRPVPWLSR